jgi:hypothetical protein
MAENRYNLPNRPLFMQAQTGDTAIDYSAADFRDLLTNLYAAPGILSAGSYVVTQNSVVGWSVKVFGGAAILSAGYQVSQPSSVAVSLAAFDTTPSALRSHRVWIAVYDKLTNPSLSEYDAAIVVTEDTGAGAPPPVGATNSLFLAFVKISPGQANIQDENIYDYRPHAQPGTPFTPLYIRAGFLDAAASSNVSPVGVQYQNGRAYLSGGFRRDSSTPFTSLDGFECAYVPRGFEPKYEKYMIAATGMEELVGGSPVSTLTARVIVRPDRTVAVVPGETNYPRYIFLDGLSYDLDH